MRRADAAGWVLSSVLINRFDDAMCIKLPLRELDLNARPLIEACVAGTAGPGEHKRAHGKAALCTSKGKRASDVRLFPTVTSLAFAGIIRGENRRAATEVILICNVPVLLVAKFCNFKTFEISKLQNEEISNQKRSNQKIVSSSS
jgi:hypothetical protein